MAFSPQTTAPGAAETHPASRPIPSLALLVLWSASQPQQVGWLAFLPSFERRFVGRGDPEYDKFALFGPHRPGAEPVARYPEGFLQGNSVSRRQLSMYATAVAVEMEKVGRCVTLVNGQEQERASLQPGDTVMLRNEALLMCVRRPRVLPMPRGMTALHAFGEPDAAGIVGESPAAWRLREQLLHAACGDEHVLIQGETGSGKELAAAAIHQGSSRARGPFIAHNASTFTLSLLESELFGNVAGYPNPTMPARKGLLPSADRGTLFLDEIGDCPLEAQAQLLRALELGAYTPVGESVARRVDVRVVGATHRDDTHFRPDFRGRFLRSVQVPPLRERPEDIPLLIRHLLRQLARERVDIEKRFFDRGPSGHLEPRISGRLVESLVRQPLPLNVRGLHSQLVQALDASPGHEVKLPPSSATSPPLLPAPHPPQARAERAERAERTVASKDELLACLMSEQWNVSRVARRLELHRNTVYRLIESYGLRRDETA